MTRGKRGPLRARHPGSVCKICGQPIRQGALITRWEAAWAHWDCAEARKPVLAILEGTTYRSQAASTWRRGRSPGSTG